MSSSVLFQPETDFFLLLKGFIFKNQVKITRPEVQFETKVIQCGPTLDSNIFKTSGYGPA